MRSFHRLLFALALAGAIVSQTAAPASAATVERASIIPLVNAFVGPAVNNLPGFSIYANGVSDYWSTANAATVSFAVFVFPGRQMTQDIGFSVMPPDGQKPVYAYTFKRQSIAPVGSWFTFAATGDFSKPGIYEAIATADGQEIGRIPVVLVASSGA